MIGRTMNWNNTNKDGSPLRGGITENTINFEHDFSEKMQHSFFTNFTQTNTWRQIQLNTCISFVINYTFWTKRHNCKAIHSIFSPLSQYDAPHRWHLTKCFFFFTNNRPIRVCEFHWQSPLPTKFKRNTVERVVELTFLHAVVKYESLWAGYGNAHCTVTHSKLQFLIVTLHFTWPWATVCVNSCISHGIEYGL